MKQSLLIILLLTIETLLLTSCEGCLQKNCITCPTNKENDLKNDLANEYNGEVRFGHDERAVLGSRSDGSFGISFDFTSVKSTEKNLCEKDSLYLDSLSRIIAKKVLHVLSHKENYNKISINYSTERHHDKEMSSTDCEKEFDIPIKDLE